MAIKKETIEFEPINETGLLGIDRIWQVGHQKIIENIYQKAKGLNWSKEQKREAINFIDRLLEDENYKKEATQGWETLIAKADNPEEKEKALIMGMIFRVDEAMRNDESLKEKGIEI